MGLSQRSFRLINVTARLQGRFNSVVIVVPKAASSSVFSVYFMGQLPFTKKLMSFILL
jgi:hypothetical protein